VCAGIIHTAALGHVAEIGDDETVAEGDLGREAHRRTTAAARHVVVISSDVAVVGPGRDQSLRCIHFILINYLIKITKL
jgi:hypothetical protein